MTNADQSMLGLGASEGGSVSFQGFVDPLLAMEFPFSYGSVFSDTIKSMLFLSTSGGYGIHYLVDHNLPVGIKEQEQISFNLFPNPVGESVNILSEKEMEGVSIYSMDGRILQSSELNQGTMETSLDINQYPRGVYIVEIRYGKGEISRERLVKH